MHHLDSMFLPQEFIDGLPESVKKNVLEIEAIDFAFELYRKVFKETDIKSVPNKFFVPYGDNKEQFFDFSFVSDENKIARAPTSEELVQRGKSIPVLPKKWYNAFLKRIDEPLLEKKKKERNLQLVKTLAVFDFDDTLFKTEEVKQRMPSDHPLSPDSLPDIAEDADWNLDVVYKAQELCSNPNVYCVMMTGRVGEFFKEKIDKLLQDRNIFFAETHYNEFGGNTVEYKTKQMYHIIDKLPNVRNLIMWEDQEDKAKQYTEEFTDKLNFKINLVNEEAP
jgi:hypothetical protein